MHTTALILLLLAGGRGSGVKSSGGDAITCRWMANGVERAVGTTNSVFSKRMAFNGTVLSMDWTQVTPGIDGLGGDTFTLSLLVDGVSACTRAIACDAARGDYTVDCGGAAFSSGQDVDIRITATSCLTQPTGFPGLDGTSK